MVSAVARAYNEGLGAEPPAGSKGRAPGQGGIAPPPEAEAHLVFGRLMEVTNLPTFLQFGNAKKPDICVIFCPKKHKWPRNWGRPGKRLGKGCAPLGPGLKPPLHTMRCTLPKTDPAYHKGM